MKWLWGFLAVGVVVAVVSSFTDVSAIPASSGAGWFEYSKAQSPDWGRVIQVGTTAKPLHTRKNSMVAASDIDDLKLLKWGDLAVVHCQGQADVCLTQTTSVTITNGANGGYINDSGSTTDGYGKCVRIEAGGRHDFHVKRATFDDASDITRRTGYCSDSSNAANYGSPCDAWVDCSNTASECTTDTPQGITGAYMMFVADAATECFVTVER